MMIGPAPMRRMDWMSVRLGMDRYVPRCFAIMSVKSLEKITRVMRSGRRLRMVLHGEDRQLTMGQSFDGIVVQVQMGYLSCAFERIRVHREPVILRGDLDFARGQIHHRLIAAVVAELELVSLAAEREPHDLMAEANPEDRFLADELAYVFFGIRHGVGIAGTVGEKNAVGIQRQNIFR